MSEPFVPTIIFPNGGETLLDTEATVRWTSPNINNLGIDRPTSYEIYFTDDYNPSEEPDWKQIAVVPATTSSFVWRFGRGLRSSRCRVAIRSRTPQGERSQFSVSAANFAVQRKKLQAPSVVTPVGGETYDKFVEIITDNSAILGSYSQRSFYQFYYSSASANIAPTSIAQNVPIDSDPVIWKTVNLPPATDYILQIYLSDEDGNVSDSVFIRDIHITHQGFFYVDTTPPEGSIQIANNATFTNTRNVNLKLASYDETTGVHSMQIIEQFTDSKGVPQTVQSVPDAFSDIKQYNLSQGDALKTLQLLLQDYAGNRNTDNIQRIFAIEIENASSTIVDMALDDDDELNDEGTDTLFAVTTGTTQALYSLKDFPSLLANIEETPTAIAIFKHTVYVATKTSTNTGDFLMYDGTGMTTVKTFTDTDSVVNSMFAHLNTLYLGMESGDVYGFDGLNFTLVDTLPNPVKSLYSDGNLLYLTQKNDFNLYIFNGTSFFEVET